ncbi:MAG: rRNA maturation RNase YbeY [Patescibacteria group bacterium]
MRLEINNTTKNKINTKILHKGITAFNKKMKAGDKAVSVAFVSEAKIKELNKHYRGVNKVTDILSFTPTPLISKHYIAEKKKSVGKGKFKNKKYESMVCGCTGDKDNFGELIICYPQIKRQAKEERHSVDYELLFIFIHGLLHLADYDDETDKGREEMIALGEKLCKFNNY